MAEPIRCPSCQNTLRVPADFHLAWLTCPRCLAVVANPASEAVTPRIPPSTRVVTESSPTVPAEGGRSETPCRACGKPTLPQWLFCPYCEEPLHSPTGGMDARVKRDSQWTAGGMVLLAILGALGIIWALLASGGELLHGDPSAFVAVLIGLFLLVGVSALFALWRSKGDVRARGIGRIFLGTLTLVGGMIAISGLVLLAVALFFLVVCFAGGKC